MTDFTVMIDNILDDVHEAVETKLRMSEISAPEIGLNEVFDDIKYKDPFRGLHSEHLRNKYFSEHMMLIVCKT